MLVAMIFLVILTLIVISAIRTTNVNTRIVGNMQTQDEAESAAQKTIEEAITSAGFTLLPVEQTSTVDINNSGQSGATYTVKLTPTCIAKQPKKMLDLDVDSESDRPCFASSSAQNTGIIGASPSGNSLCTDAVWNLKAVATPPNAKHPAATIDQGVTQRVDPGANC